MYDYLFKLCIFGDGGVGKTTLVKRYLTGLFNEEQKITIGVDFYTKTVEVGNIVVAIQIWDFAGEERFRTFLPDYLRGTSGGIMMFDMSRYLTFKNLDKWIDLIVNYSEKPIPIILVGGKFDLVKGKNNYGFNLNSYLNYDLIVKYVICSSKTGENVDFIFEEIAKIMLYNSDKELFKDCVNNSNEKIETRNLLNRIM